MKKTILIIFSIVFGIIIFIAIASRSSDKPTVPYKHEIKPATDQQIFLINEDLVNSYKLNECYMIRSKNHVNVYYVSGDLFSDGDYLGRAIWTISGNPTSPNMIMTLNNLARSATPTYPFAPNTKAEIYMSDPEVQLLLEFEWNG